jgi:hypothetical protein
MGDALARCILGSAASLALLAGAPSARAEGDCARMTAAPDLPPTWADALRDLTRELAALPSADCQPLTLSVEPADGSVRIVAVADDGRRAERHVAEPSMLVPIALGLVISIPRLAPEKPAPGASREAEPRARPSEASGAEERATTSPLPVAPRPELPSHPAEVWLGLALGGRFGVPSTVSMVDVEARVDLRIDRLLMFVSFRNVPLGFVASEGFDGDAYRESSIAFGIGRSLSLGSCVLDVSAAPSLVTMRLGRDAPDHVRADDVDLRLGASVRLNVPLAKAWRFTVTADTDVIPDALRSAVRVDPLPAFPAWTSGLRFGASGAVL